MSWRTFLGPFQIWSFCVIQILTLNNNGHEADTAMQTTVGYGVVLETGLSGRKSGL